MRSENAFELTYCRRTGLQSDDAVGLLCASFSALLAGRSSRSIAPEQRPASSQMRGYETQSSENSWLTVNNMWRIVSAS